MGLTRIRADQISNIDYKQATRVITVANVTLSGGAPSEVDGVTLVAGDRVLVTGQTTGSQNGIYVVTTLGTGSNGTWTRSADGNADGEIEAGMIIMVTEGTVYKDTQWKLTTNNPIVIGTTALVFEQNSAFAFGNIYANGTAVLANTVGSTVTLTPGDNIAITGNNTSKTVTIGVTGISLNSISNGTSNVNVTSSGGNVTVGVGGTSNIAVFSTAGVDVTGRVSATGNITGGNLSGTSIAGTLTTAAQTNITSVGTLTSLSVSGNVTGGNINTAGVLSGATLETTGNATIGGNLTVNGNIVYVNISDLNVEDPIIGLGRGPNNTPLTTDDGKDRGEQLWYYTSAEKSAFIGYDNSADKLIAALDVSIANEIVTVNSYGSFVVGTLEAATISASGNVTGGNLITGGVITATGNITGGNLITGGQANITGNLTTANAVNFNLPNSSSTDVTISSGLATAFDTRIGTTATNQYSWRTNLYYDGAAWQKDDATRGAWRLNQVCLTGNANSVMQFTYAPIGSTDVNELMTLTGEGLLSVTGNISGGNISTGGVITATGNITGGNISTTLLTATTLSATGNVQGGNLRTAGLISATGTVTGTTFLGNVAGITVSASGNVTGGNILTGGLISATANITGGNVLTGGLISAAANVTGGNILTGGVITATGNITGGNVLGGVLFATTTTANTVTARLTTGNDNNFRITAQNGVASNTTGTEVSRLGMNYVGTGWDSFTQYIRGSAAQNGAQILWAANTAIANVNSTGVSVTGVMSASGNVTGGNILTGGLITATGNITGGNILGNGAGLSGINAFSNITVTGGNSVVADNISDTLTLTAGDGIALVADTANSTITIAQSGSGDSIFATGGDMGTVTEAVTASEDLGLVTETPPATEIDMGTIVTAGVFYPEQLVLPSKTVAELGNLSASPAGQFVFCSNESGGSIPAFSDGTNWRRVTDRAIVT